MAAFLVVILAAAVTFDVMIGGAWQASLRTEIERNLTQKTQLLGHRVETDRTHSLADIAAQEGQSAGARVTIIDPTGKVLADSEANPVRMENHATRPEFVAALAGKIGVNERRSATIGIPFLYIAVPVSGGAVRLAYPLSDVEAVAAQVRHRLALASGLAFLFALIVAAAAAHWSARRLERIVDVAARIAEGDLHARIKEPSQDEIGRVASAIDKTARQVEQSFAAVRSSQHQLETLLNSMQDAVIAVSADGLVQWANQPMNRLVPQGTRLQQPVVETIRDPDFLASVKQAANTHAVKTARATSIVYGRVFDVTAAPLPDGGAVAVLRDLTETERVEKTRRDFIANVSHELRTPLTSIQGYTETLLDSTLDNVASTREFLEIIRKNSSRMSRLTEDLLTLARVESGETRFDVESVPPAELLHDAEESFREIARTHGIDLQIQDLKPGDSSARDFLIQSLPPVLADREAIHQVFSNLIDNALKYGASGGRIVLGARSAPHAVEFFVQDFGAGIPSEHLARLFERFYRVDKARSRESGGTGLGLAIAKHIVMAHGGSIRAESELAHGSTFLFTLPSA
ncbi:MAG: two-component system, OmpR family, phosphate regulon sensor histidine kinase PhoR [Acidobacteriaceae bacterium]|nr:two-component system, OmpR family, phosphate regulon sensor histidine kinase PhoR [Acidobacteriaceae bacterium]